MAEVMEASARRAKCRGPRLLRRPPIAPSDPPRYRRRQRRSSPEITMIAARLLALALCLALAPRPVPAQEPPLVMVGTGAITGVYYPVGVALCRLFNQHRRDHGMRCSARPAEGSVGNIEDLRAGTIDLAIVQSDTQADALEGAAGFAAAGPFEGLRAVMSLHPEPLTVVARADAGIAGVADLAGKRVAVGSPGSGTRAIADVLMAGLGWTTADFAAAPELETGRQGQALCAGEIDAYLFAVGHPALAIQETAADCDVVLVPAAGPAVDALLAANPHFFEATIPAGLYRGTDREVATFGVGATLVTRAEVPEDTVYRLVSSVFDDFETLRGLNPALVSLEARDMASEGLTAPLHPGAARYYREQGWLP
jgi:TRAP transporter TAXI family solute receptor